MILGHEASGVVAEVGANLADRFKVSHRDLILRHT
jgi:Zn-dependent alcohol dehydrogenase